MQAQHRSADMPLNILVIRRDNIGDLVCTTPAFRAIRAQIPSARICALVNSYNAEVLYGNADVDRIYVYKKLKHRGDESPLAVLAAQVAVAWTLRRERFDYAILGGTRFSRHAWRIARLAAPKRIVGYADTHRPSSGTWLPPPTQPVHEVETMFPLLAQLGIEGPPPPLSMAARADAVAAIRRVFHAHGVRGVPLAIHISARKPSNRWPPERFAALIQTLHNIHAREFVLLWSPGDSANPQHPGDDAHAAQIVAACPGIPIAACRTDRLAQLVAALSLCDACICGDGGAMHVAAALNKRILCFFGDSDSECWRPWRVPHVLLQKRSRRAADIGVEEAVAAFAALMA